MSQRTEALDRCFRMLPEKPQVAGEDDARIRIKQEFGGPDAQEKTVVYLKKLYSAMQTLENRLGGGEGIEGIYGSITRTGTSKIMDAMAKLCSLNEKSCLADVGSGLCRPLIHAVLGCRVKRAVGFEVDPIKCQKAASFISQLGRLPFVKASAPALLDSLINVQCVAVEKLTALHEITHMYTFWEGIPTAAKHAVGRLVHASPHLRCVAVVQRSFRGASPEDHMLQYGFGPLKLLTSFPVSMGGSGRTFTSYIFAKVDSFSTRKVLSPKMECKPQITAAVHEHEKVCGKLQTKRPLLSVSPGAMGAFYSAKKLR